MNLYYRKAVGLITVLLMLVLLPFVCKAKEEQTAGSGRVEAKEETGFCVVLDAGHGGNDPGKIGLHDTLEKDLNLEIVMLIKSYLEADDVRVVLTRDGDEGLYDASASNKKVQDMKRRVEIITQTMPDITVSIHQNSYPEEYVHGAQVFYYTNSAASRELAEKIQQRLLLADSNNKRDIKANDSYYLLKKTPTPTVIVECGFLSNEEEAARLSSEDYRKKIAWEIHLGILQYLNENK